MSWLHRQITKKFQPSMWPLAQLLLEDPIQIACDSWLGRIPFHISNRARRTHLYCLGKSGKGKSKLLEHLFVSDVRSGRGCGLLDPHEDLAIDVIAHLATLKHFDTEASKKIIYLDPTRTDYTIPFNVLNAPYPSHIIAKNIIEAFRRAWPSSLREAPRFNDVAFPALRILIETGQTLVDLRRLLRDPGYREMLIAKVKDQHLAREFQTEYMSWDKDRLTNTESVKNKLTDFVYNPDVRRCLGATTNHLNFKKIMDEGKILIVNLKHCDIDTRRLIGSLITIGFEQAALSRGENRTPFYLYLDEFQNFTANEGSSATLGDILSECRKFGLHIHLFHQNLGQLRTDLISALGNVGIKITFSTEYEDAKALVHKFWISEHEELKLNEAAAVIQNLPPRTALIKVDGWRLCRVKTIPIPRYSVGRDEVDEILGKLIKQHGVPTKLLDRTVFPPPPVAAKDWTRIEAKTNFGFARSR